MKKTRHLAMIVAAVLVVLAVGAVSAYASLADDATPPATTSDAVASYWNDATVTLSATDNEGVAYIYHELDDDVVRLYTVGTGVAELVAPLDWEGNKQALTPGEHTLKFWAQDVNGNVEAKQSVKFTVLEDVIAPTTTPSGATGGAWYNTDLLVHLAADDKAEGSGVAAITSTLDGGVPQVASSSATNVWLAVDAVTHANDGAHTLTFQAEDVVGNLEGLQTMTVNVDTAKPAPRAPYAATAYRGRTATLKYKVVDAAPNGGTASGKLVVKNPAGKVVKTLKYSGKTVGVVYPAKFSVPKLWKAGTYKFYVYATDTAGNVQAKAAVNKLVVK